MVFDSNLDGNLNESLSVSVKFAKSLGRIPSMKGKLRPLSVNLLIKPHNRTSITLFFRNIISVKYPYHHNFVLTEL
jgi:hypothetical protein